MIMGHDIGWLTPSIHHRGMMGYRTPNIDRIGNDCAMFTDWHGEKRCTGTRPRQAWAACPFERR
jgi:arylsulfatase A-like enzyme